jgi:hypothetical protein
VIARRKCLVNIGVAAHRVAKPTLVGICCVALLAARSVVALRELNPLGAPDWRDKLAAVSLRASYISVASARRQHRRRKETQVRRGTSSGLRVRFMAIFRSFAGGTRLVALGAR